MTFSPSPHRAFTLLETVIVIALSAAMMVALSALIYNFNEASTYEEASAASSGSAINLMREIESLVAPADAVVQMHKFEPSGVTYTSSPNVLVLEIPSVDSSGNVIANTYDYAAFYVVGTDAYRILEANTTSNRISGTKQLSSTVSSLTFSYNNADFTTVNTVTADVQTLAQVKQNALTDHLNEQIRLRNF